MHIKCSPMLRFLRTFSMVFRDLIETHSGEKNYVAICSKLSENKWLDFPD